MADSPPRWLVALRPVARLVTSFAGRLVISAALIALVASTIDWDVLRDSVADASWGWFALAVGLLLVAFLVGATRWLLLLRAAEVPTGAALTVRAYWIGVFSNNFLPTGFGGDLVRAFVVAPRGRLLSRSITSVGVDRLSALACGIALAWVGWLIERDEIPSSMPALLAGATGAGILGGALVVIVLRRRGIARALPPIARPYAAEAAATLRAYGSRPGLQARVLGLGCVFQGLIVLASWAVSETLGLDLSLPLLAVVTPLVLIATVAPISVAGLGVREGAFVALLAELGVSSAEATLLSLSLVAATAIASLPGGVAILVRGASRQGLTVR